MQKQDNEIDWKTRFELWLELNESRLREKYLNFDSMNDEELKELFFEETGESND